MADLPALLTVEAVAKHLGVSSRTIRRRICDGVIAAHRFGNNVRVDVGSVTRLLVPANGKGTQCAVPMQEDSELPQLHRQRGRDGNWTVLINGIEVSTGTADAEEAMKKVRILARHQNYDAKAPRTGRQRSGPWSVLQEKERGYSVLFYDENHRRKRHRIPADLDPPITNIDEAEKYANQWYQLHRAGRELKTVRLVEQEKPLQPEPTDASTATRGQTFQEIAQLWTSGKLAAMFPDHIKAKRSNKTDELRLAKYAYGVIGNIPASEFAGRGGLDIVERVGANMTTLNPKLRPASRRHVIQTVSHVLNLAVFPLRLIEHNPLPHGFIQTVATQISCNDGLQAIGVILCYARAE